MLLLTATTETQGQMPGDFCDAVEGELVVAFSDCHVSAHQDDLFRCREGCPARFFGLNSHERTTTARILDVPVTRKDYLLALSAYGEHRAVLPEAAGRPQRLKPRAPRRPVKAAGHCVWCTRRSA